nr:hypothetical protein [Comamonas koreensis]
MKFPSELEFMECFCAEPVELDHPMGFFRFVKASPDGCVEMDFSFSAISHSFQVRLKSAGLEVACVSSENVSQIEIGRTQRGQGIRVLFDLQGCKSEAELTVEPTLHLSWWSIQI